MIRAFALFLAVFLMPCLAQAHAPYLVKQGSVESPTGAPLIIETLNGDSIMGPFPNPSSMQLRNASGTVIAYAPTAGYTTVFCPSVQFCWAFPYEIIPISFVPWKLAYRDITYDKPFDDSLTTEQRLEFEEYLSGKTDYLSSYGFGYPEHRDTTLGFKAVPAMGILSPVFIIAAKWRAYVILAGLCLLPFFTRPFLKDWRVTRKIAAGFHITLIGITLMSIKLYGASFIYGLALIMLCRWLLKRPSGKAAVAQEPEPASPPSDKT